MSTQKIINIKKINEKSLFVSTHRNGLIVWPPATNQTWEKCQQCIGLASYCFFFVFCFFFLTSLFIETLLFVRSRLRNWRDVMRHVNGLINSRGVHLILGVPAEVFNRKEALKQREAFCLITSTSSTCFRRKDQESFKVAEYPLLIRLEIHISLSNPNICQNLHSGLMRCHR